MPEIVVAQPRKGVVEEWIRRRHAELDHVCDQRDLGMIENRGGQIDRIARHLGQYCGRRCQSKQRSQCISPWRNPVGDLIRYGANEASYDGRSDMTPQI